MKSILKRSLIGLPVLLLLCGFTCQLHAPTLLQEIGNSAAVIVAAADPSLSPWVTDAQQQINCALAPGTTMEKVDSCLALALTQYQAALPHANAKDTAIIKALILVIEGFVNDNTPSGTITTSAGLVVPSQAKAAVKTPSAKAPSASQFKANFNALLKANGVKKKI
jgi:hypothetical protein